MKIKVKRAFHYQDGKATKTLQPGTYKVPSEVSEYVAELARKWGKVEIIPAKIIPIKSKKRAPENKVRVVE